MPRLYTPPNVTHAEALFTDTARVARLIATQRVDDARTNDVLAASINLGKGNVISMLKDISYGAPGKPLSPDNLLRLAKEVGLAACRIPIGPEMGDSAAHDTVHPVQPRPSLPAAT